MSKEKRIRKMRNESRTSFLADLLICLIVAIGAVFVFPKSGPIGGRTMFALFATDMLLMLWFMYLLEKYSVMISGLYEKTLITVLSALFTFSIVCVVNLIFFMSYEKFIVDLIVTGVEVVAIFLSDFFLGKFYSSPRFFRKPRLLIIGSDESNFYRMKRIKYGVLEKYDSWYENVSDMDMDSFKSSIESWMNDYDALCVLDGIKDDEYGIAVNSAVAMNKNLFIVPKLVDVGKTNARLVRFDDILTLYMPEKSLSYIELFVKRSIDLIFGLIGFVLAFIPMLIIALLIKITSPGPVFYKQTRLTRNKKEFEIYKFRTMIPDAEKLSGPKFAEKDDPRITKIGKILRACRLDELPQILNILKGDMSVVGPRPERPVFVSQFEQEIENYNYRFEVKAGLTSLSHVYGRYSTYIHDRTYYDLFYITHYSILMDLKIILLTTKTLFLKSAAEGEDTFKEKTVVQENTEVKNIEETKS